MADWLENAIRLQLNGWVLIAVPEADLDPQIRERLFGAPAPSQSTEGNKEGPGDEPGPSAYLY